MRIGILIGLMVLVGCSGEDPTTTLCEFDKAVKDAESAAQMLEATKNQLHRVCELAYGEEWYFSEYRKACVTSVEKPLPGVAVEGCDDAD